MEGLLMPGDEVLCDGILIDGLKIESITFVGNDGYLAEGFKLNAIPLSALDDNIVIDLNVDRWVYGSKITKI